MSVSQPQTVVNFCRPARLTDVPALVELCARWQRDQVKSTLNGFLGVGYPPEGFQQLITAEDIVVTTSADRLIGYYLVNSVCETSTIDLHRLKVEHLKAVGKIPLQARIGLGAQVLVDMDFQGKGIRQRMLKLLAELKLNKFEYLFSTISKENPRAYRAHTKDGWNVVDEDETYSYVIFSL